MKVLRKTRIWRSQYCQITGEKRVNAEKMIFYWQYTFRQKKVINWLVSAFDESLFELFRFSFSKAAQRSIIFEKFTDK